MAYRSPVQTPPPPWEKTSREKGRFSPEAIDAVDQRGKIGREASQQASAKCGVLSDRRRISIIDGTFNDSVSTPLLYRIFEITTKIESLQKPEHSDIAI